MSSLRNIYLRYFQGTALGNAARRLRYWDWRNDIRMAGQKVWPRPAFKSQFIEWFHTGIDQAGLLWLGESRETSNFTYNLTPRNERHLAQLLALMLERSPAEIAGYIGE